MLTLIGAVTLGSRLAVLTASTEATMDADAAHFMNVARCFERGQGFSNPAAWPAWMKPDRLPMPETFKEPAYPWAIAQLAPLAGSPFRAGQLLSLLAGLLTPFLTWGLVRRLHPERAVADLAALLCAASPLLIAQSTRVMVESVFAATFTLLWLLLAPRPGEVGRHARARDVAADAAAGAAAGIAFMLRAQALLAAPAIVVLLLAGSASWRIALRRGGVVLLAAIVTASPFLLRNLRLFGSPFHSDVAAFGLWPYRDLLSLSATLERPPAPLGFALHHVREVLTHVAASAVRFTVQTCPREILGNPVWMVALAAGVALTLSRWRAWLFAYVQIGLTLGLLFAVNWDARYFASLVPLWCAIAATGALWIARALGPLPLAGGLRGSHLLAGTLVALVLLQAAATRRDVAGHLVSENVAARAEAPFLRAHLGPDESVMALTTSFYAYWADRHAVFIVIADTPDFMDVVRRLHVRYAAFPTSQLDDLAARYPGGRLPPALVVDHADSTADVTVFRVRDRGAGANL